MQIMLAGRLTCGARSLLRFLKRDVIAICSAVIRNNVAVECFVFRLYANIDHELLAA